MQPNILFIITDQQRCDTIGAYGSAVDATPTIDQMAADGCRFENIRLSNDVTSSVLGFFMVNVVGGKVRYTTQHTLFAVRTPYSQS